MEEKNSLNNIGNLVVSDEVIASIAINAAKDVDGVSSFAVRTPDVHSIFKIGEGPMKSVRVISSDNDIKIHIHVNIEPGKKIPNVAADIQKSVKNAVQSMTGKMVSKVNVVIEDMDVAPKAEKEDE
ncbi:MAG: Asp23/Gls24 family envelope stress response protein [Oscillospiraceae bacterium]|nr:Asp23/Gls24 family envelope stress response protein [Oscillospiraceae bacterium]